MVQRKLRDGSPDAFRESGELLRWRSPSRWPEMPPEISAILTGPSSTVNRETSLYLVQNWFEELERLVPTDN